MPITKWDSSSASLVSKRIEEVLQPLAKELGIRIRRGGGTFLETNFSMKLQIDLAASDGHIVEKSESEFKALAHLYGLKETDLGRKVTCGGQELILTGLKARSSKFPFLGKDVLTGKVYKLPVKAVKASLGYKVEEWER